MSENDSTEDGNTNYNLELTKLKIHTTKTNRINTETVAETRRIKADLLQDLRKQTINLK